MELTLNKIRNCKGKPCKDSWKELLTSFNKTKADDTAVSMSHLLESNGVNDALWVIYNCIEGESGKKSKMIHELAKLAKAIEAAKLYFENPSDAAGAYAGASAWAVWAAGAAAWAAWAAAWAVWAVWAAGAAGEAKIVQKQKEIILKYFGDI